MTTIDPRQQLAAALQAQLAAVRKGGRGTRTARGDVQQLAATSLAQRVRALAADDPDRRQKAVRLYLEAEFAREFGTGVLTDPAFAQMVDAVQAQMAQDTQTASAVLALGDLLLAGSAR